MTSARLSERARELLDVLGLLRALRRRRRQPALRLAAPARDRARADARPEAAPARRARRRHELERSARARAPDPPAARPVRAHGGAGRAQHERRDERVRAHPRAWTTAKPSPKGRPRRSKPTRRCSPPTSGRNRRSEREPHAPTGARMSEPAPTLRRSRARGTRRFVRRHRGGEGRLARACGAGEIVALIGANGAGKTSVLKAIVGLVPLAGGSVRALGRELAGVPTHRIVELGVTLVPEGRAIFGGLTVRENLELGAFTKRDPKTLGARLERVVKLFPRLGERLAQAGGTLSGGEQQMLAIGRALMGEPKLLCSTSRASASRPSSSRRFSRASSRSPKAASPSCSSSRTRASRSRPRTPRTCSSRARSRSPARAPRFARIPAFEPRTSAKTCTPEPARKPATVRLDSKRVPVL